jgi:hypothetical protein
VETAASIRLNPGVTFMTAHPDRKQLETPIRAE